MFSQRKDKKEKLMNLFNEIRSDCEFYKMYKLAKLDMHSKSHYNDKHPGIAKEISPSEYYYKTVVPMEQQMAEQGGEEKLIEKIKKNTAKLAEKLPRYKRNGWIKQSGDSQLIKDCETAIDYLAKVKQDIHLQQEKVTTSIDSEVFKHLGVSASSLMSPKTVTSTSSIFSSLEVDQSAVELRLSETEHESVSSPSSIASAESISPISESPAASPKSKEESTNDEDDYDQSERFVL